MASVDVKQRLADDVALWQADGIIDDATRKTLQARYDTPGFGLSTAIRYAGIAGGVLCAFGVLGVLAAASQSPGAIAFMLALVAGFLTYSGLRMGRDPLGRYVHTSRLVLALGVFAWCGAVLGATKALDMSSSSSLVVVGFGVLPLAFVIAYREQNGFLLLMGLLGFFHWIGNWSSMMGRSTYSTDIEDPRAMALVSLAVFAIGLAHERVGKPPRFNVVYQTLALIYLNLSLLILSIYPEATAAIYIVVLTVAAFGQIFLGARLKSPLVMGFGVTMLAIDMFTRYYERLWAHLDKGLFFVAGGLLMMGFGALFERSYRGWVRR